MIEYEIDSGTTVYSYIIDEKTDVDYLYNYKIKEFQTLTISYAS